MSAIDVASRRRTVVRAAWLFDGTSATLQADPVVVVDGDRIVAVDKRIDLPVDAEVVDLRAATLLPGLIDTHVHLCFDASADPVSSLMALDNDETLAAMARAARTAVEGGVTTVRDLGDRNYLSLRLRDRPGLPTIVCAGPPVTTPGGHCHFLGGVASLGPSGIRDAVRNHAERGVDVIKVMASGGLLTPGTREDQAQFSREELRAAVDAAHRHGLGITAHVHATTAICNAIDVGFDGLEHVSFWTHDGVDEAPGDLVAAIVDRGIAIGATAGFAPVGAALEPRAAQRLPGIIANMVRLLEAGAVLVAGTDAGVHPTKPHDVLTHGIAQLVMCGMTAHQALLSATSIGAKVCGLGHCKGRLAPGFDADILAVDGNPLADPAALRNIRAVWARGTRIR